jgi:ABC-type transport system involved in multi-copper enzyme maturation permease subunit
MKSLIKAELQKLVTTRGAFGLLIGAIAINILAVVAPGENAITEFSRPLFEQQWVFIVGTLMRVFLLVLGIRAVTDEFRHGTITPTLLSAPRRPQLVGAKLVALAGSGLAFAVVSGTALISTAFTIAAMNNVTLHVTSDEWTIFVGMGLAGMLWPMIGVGLGLLIRSQVAAVVGGLVWLMAIEEMVRGRLGDLAGYLPGQAGLGMTLAHRPDILLHAALILAAYVLVTGTLGVVVMRRRDVS